jgi:hypothetical protein
MAPQPGQVDMGSTTAAYRAGAPVSTVCCGCAGLKLCSNLI